MAHPFEETKPRPTKDRGPGTLPAAGAGGSGRRVRPSVADHAVAHRGAQVRGAGGGHQDDAGRGDATDAHGTRGRGAARVSDGWIEQRGLLGVEPLERGVLVEKGAGTP